MSLTLDFNTELYPLKKEEEFSLVLASSLVRGGGAAASAAGAANGTDGTEEEKEIPVWRPDGKGRGGLEEEYDYVMYGKVAIVFPPILFISELIYVEISGV